MPCCKCCCGNQTCSEGQQGKCCCGGSSGTCCQTGQYCCNGACQNTPCQTCVYYCEKTAGQPSRGCGEILYYSRTLTVPAGYNTVRIRGSADDQLRITYGGSDYNAPAGNCLGSYTPNCIPLPAGQVVRTAAEWNGPSPAGVSSVIDYTFNITAGGTFTIAARDNFGIDWGYDLEICYSQNPTWFSTLNAENAELVPPMTPDVGPGAELKALLAKIGITASPTCQCNSMATRMNQWGAESLDHIEEIVDVMQQSAKDRGLPFLRTVGRQLVKLAVRRWKKANSQ